MHCHCCFVHLLDNLSLFPRAIVIICAQIAVLVNAPVDYRDCSTLLSMDHLPGDYFPSFTLSGTDRFQNFVTVSRPYSYLFWSFDACCNCARPMMEAKQSYHRHRSLRFPTVTPDDFCLQDPRCIDNAAATTGYYCLYAFAAFHEGCE